MTKPATPSVVVTVRMPRALYARLAQFATRDGRDVSNAVRKLLTDALTRKA